MKIYVHKVRMSPIDGWGRSISPFREILGRYHTKEKAVKAKHDRDANHDATYCDIGPSWIEEEIVE